MYEDRVEPPRPLLTSLILVLLGCALACGAPTPPADSTDNDHDDVAFALEAAETALRPAVRKRLLNDEHVSRGARPVALASNGQSYMVITAQGWRIQGGGLLRTSDVADASVVAAVDDAFVVGSGVRNRVWIVPPKPLDPVRSVSLPVPGVTAVSAADNLFDVGGVDGDVVTFRDETLLSWCPASTVGLGISSLVRLPHHLVALSSLRHRVVVFPLEEDGDDAGAPVCTGGRSFEFDGLLFSLVAREDEEGAVDVVVSGVEDHPLDRRGGSFGNIDSFAFGLRFTADDVIRVWERNLSNEGVVNGIALVAKDDLVLVVGKGSGRRAWLDRADGRVVAVTDGPAGIGAAALVFEGDDEALAFVNVIDGTLTVDGVLVDLEGPKDGRSDAEKLGERLVFTTMMAPQQSSRGILSRFTCETCHLGGGVDGRVHQTGRVDDEGHAVTATTKPLWGLFQNPPLFTRAMDRSVSVMVHAEFKVANRNSPQHPWFSAAGKSPEDLRSAVVAFFASFDPPPNPRRFARKSFRDDEARGFLLFQQRCIACHAGRVFADSEEAADFDVEAAVWSGALVWGRSGFADTGVRPKVHDEGARPSSLRGIGTKTPLLTNGRHRDLETLLDAVRIDGGAVRHEGPQGQPLAPEEQRLLLSFLRLL